MTTTAAAADSSDNDDRDLRGGDDDDDDDDDVFFVVVGAHIIYLIEAESKGCLSRLFVAGCFSFYFVPVSE
jgi:hypothetical protein